jgi:hypothetical protein
MGNAPISWKAKKQKTVSRSCEVQWLTYILQDLGINFVTPALLFYDNESAIHIAHNAVFH